jgi:hypothetical protein
MRLPRRQLEQFTAVAVMLVSLFGQTASSQTARTIKIVVPVPPGGAKCHAAS